jgi:uncharacterized membrane protein
VFAGVAVLVAWATHSHPDVAESLAVALCMLIVLDRFVG